MAPDPAAAAAATATATATATAVGARAAGGAAAAAAAAPGEAAATAAVGAALANFEDEFTRETPVDSVVDRSRLSSTAIEKSHFDGFTFVGEGGALAAVASADDEDELRRELRRSGSGAGAGDEADIDAHLVASPGDNTEPGADNLDEPLERDILSPAVGSPGLAGAISDGGGDLRGGRGTARSDDW